MLRERVPPEVFVRGRVALAERGRIRAGRRPDLAAAAVIDARGPGDTATLQLGWQKFVGQTLHTARPHGVDRPMVMDATVEQVDGYPVRLPAAFWCRTRSSSRTPTTATRRTSTSPCCSRASRVRAGRGWAVQHESRLESGVLPVVLAGDFAAYWPPPDHASPRPGCAPGCSTRQPATRCPDAVRLACRRHRTPDLSHQTLVALTHRPAARPGTDRGSIGRSPPCCSRPPSRTSAIRCWSGSIGSAPTWCSASTPPTRPGPIGADPGGPSAGYRSAVAALRSSLAAPDVVVA